MATTTNAHAACISAVAAAILMASAVCVQASPPVHQDAVELLYRQCIKFEVDGPVSRAVDVLPIIAVTKNAKVMAQVRSKATNGNPHAQNVMGFLYANGLGVPKDYAQAASWASKAAAQGSAEAQYDLGFMYATGLGVPQDYAKALPWYRKAVSVKPAAFFNPA